MYVTVWDVPGREQWGRPRTAECREWQNEYFSKKNIFLPSADIKVMTKITFSTTNDGDGARCWWRSWLRHCATSWKVAGSIPDGVIGIFHWRNPSGCTMALGLTQPLTEMSTRNISWGKRRPVRRADNLTTFKRRLSWNLGASTSWNTQSLSRPVIGLLVFLA